MSQFNTFSILILRLSNFAEFDAENWLLTGQIRPKTAQNWHKIVIFLHQIQQNWEEMEAR